MNFYGLIMKLAGWKIEVKAPNPDKCLILVAPHTSNWDLIIGKLAYKSTGRNASFLMKDTWFFFPMGWIFRKMGSIPVPRKRKGPSVVESVVKKFGEMDKLQLAITPEGTRSRTDQWKTGFIHISVQAQVPCLLAVIDYEHKFAKVNDVFIPTGNVDEDMRAIKEFYKPYKGKYPEKFSTDVTI